MSLRCCWSLLLTLAASLPAQTRQPLSTSFRLSSTEPALAFDEARQRLVLAMQTGEFWEWDGTSWACSQTSLPGGVQHLVYDPARQRVFVFGGTGQPTMFEFDGHHLRSLGTAPSTRCIAADPARGRLVALVPGIPSTTTWEWDGNSWQSVATTGPGFGTQTSLVHDPARQCTMAMTVAVPGNVRELWQWDGTLWTLRTSTPVTSGPSGYLAFDPVRQQVLACGAATWAFTGTAWRPLTSSDPFTTATGVLATASQRGLIYRLGDPGSATLMAWNSSGWTTAAQEPHPERRGATFTFDRARGHALLFGGLFGNRVLDSLHRWDGAAWTELTQTLRPAPRRFHTQVFDRLHGDTIVFGGLDANSAPLGDTWAFDGTSWRQLASTSQGPGARYGHAMAFDGQRGLVVLLGGTDAAQTLLADQWQSDGNSWQLTHSSTPIGPISTGVMGYDEARQRCVLVVARDTFEYDGVQWSPMAQLGPYLVDATTLVFDDQRQRLQAVLLDNFAAMSVHEWTGAAWQLRQTARGLLAYDPLRDALLEYHGTALYAHTALPAQVTDFGAPCGGTATTPFVHAYGLPRPGNASFHLDVRADAAQQPAALGLALLADNRPLGHGCTLLLQQPIGSLALLTDATGNIHQPLPVPDSLALRGVSCVAQAAVLAPASPFGAVLSQGLTLHFGD